MPCAKQKRYYSVCRHDAKPLYVFCDTGEHENDQTQNAACYLAAPHRNKTTVVTPIDQKYCSKDCEAEYDRWCCCLCNTWVIGPRERNDNNDLCHLHIEISTPEGSEEAVEHLIEHIYCECCTVLSAVDE